MKAEITTTLLSTIQDNSHPEFGRFPPENEKEIRDITTKGFCAIVFPSGTISFCYRYRNKDGKACKYTIGKLGSKKTVATARAAVDQLSAKVTLGDDVHQLDKTQIAAAKRMRQSTLKVFFDEEYTPYCHSHMKQGAVRIKMLRSYFVDEWPDLPLIDINNWLVMSWRKKKLASGLKAAGVNRPVSGLKALLNRAKEWGVIKANPLTLSPLPEDKKPVTRYLSEDEEKRLRSALQQRQSRQRLERDNHIVWQSERGQKQSAPLNQKYTDYLMPLVLVAINTGCRRGELFDLRIDSLDFIRKEITLVGENTKSGNSRVVPMSREAEAVLKVWILELDIKDRIFCSRVTGGRIDNINKSWSSLINAAQIVNFRFHDLRHTFASKLVMRGVDLYTVKELLGHASIETTQRYAHLGPEYKTRAIALLDDTDQQESADEVRKLGE